MSKTLFITCSDDRSGRKGGLYEQTQRRIASILGDWVQQHHFRLPEFDDCDPLMRFTDPARNGRVYKPWLIWKTLRGLQDGDFLIYNDCSAEIWPRTIDLRRFSLDVIQEMTAENDGFLVPFVKWDLRPILPGELGIHVHDLFTLDSCLEIMGMEQYRYDYLCASGMICIQKTPFTVGIVDRWLYYNRIPECACVHVSEFEDSYWSLRAGRKLGNRHDQSILSLLLNEAGYNFVDTVREDLPMFNFLNFCLPGYSYEFIPSNRPIPYYPVRRYAWTSNQPETS